MHQTQWGPERPLPPPVSLTSQSHHEKPPEVPAQVEGRQGFLPPPEKDLERPSSTRLEAMKRRKNLGEISHSKTFYYIYVSLKVEWSNVALR